MRRVMFFSGIIILVMIICSVLVQIGIHLGNGNPTSDISQLHTNRMYYVAVVDIHDGESDVMLNNLNPVYFRFCESNMEHIGFHPAGLLVGDRIVFSHKLHKWFIDEENRKRLMEKRAD